MDLPSYIYDVALSFVAKDEPLATQLVDQLSDRLNVFLYSRKQEQLAGTDGEKTFNDVFSKQARIVVVLYRDGWGETPWTRIEETAIRNRAYDEGYGFVVFMPLDERPKVPQWLPRTQLWIGLSRWGIGGAASVIDARCQERGASPRIETLEQKAVRVERERQFQKNREIYLTSDAGVRNAKLEWGALVKAILEQIPKLQAAAPSLGISAKQSENQVILLSSGVGLLVEWKGRFINSLAESRIEATIWSGHPPSYGTYFIEELIKVGSLKLLPDLDQSNEHFWSTGKSQSSRSLRSAAAAEHIVGWWLDRALNTATEK